METRLVPARQLHLRHVARWLRAAVLARRAPTVAVFSPVHAAKDLLRGLSHHGAELLSTRRNAAIIAGCGRRIAGTD
jgi:hypothetical protein